MSSFMVVSTFKPGTEMAEVMSVVAEEQAKVAELKAAGTIGALYLSTATRGTVFIEIFADDADAAGIAVASLPMAKWWDIDVFPINVPVQR